MVLKDLTPEAQIAGLIILGIVSLAAIVLIFLKGIKFNSKFANFTVQAEEHKDEKPVSPHATCKHRCEGSDAVKQMRLLSEEQVKLSMMVTIKEQMELAEEALNEMNSLFVKVFLNLLQGLGHGDPVTLPAFRSYKCVLALLESRLRSKLRVFIRENGFAEKNEREFEDYIDLRSKQLRELVSNELNDTYIYSVAVLEIPRSVLYEANVKEIHSFLEILRDMFNGCREISITTKQRVEEIDKEKAELYNMFKG